MQRRSQLPLLLIVPAIRIQINHLDPATVISCGRAFPGSISPSGDDRLTTPFKQRFWTQLDFVDDRRSLDIPEFKRAVLVGSQHAPSRVYHSHERIGVQFTRGEIQPNENEIFGHRYGTNETSGIRQHRQQACVNEVQQQSVND